MHDSNKPLVLNDIVEGDDGEMCRVGSSFSWSGCSLKGSLSKSLEWSDSNRSLLNSFSELSLIGPLSRGNQTSFSFSASADSMGQKDSIDIVTRLPSRRRTDQVQVLAPVRVESVIESATSTDYHAPSSAEGGSCKWTCPLIRLAEGFALDMDNCNNKSSNKYSYLTAQMDRLLKEYVVNDERVVCLKTGNHISSADKAAKNATTKLLKREYTAKLGWKFDLAVNVKIGHNNKPHEHLPRIKNKRAIMVSDSVLDDGGIFQQLVRKLWKTDAQSSPSRVATTKATVLLLTMFSPQAKDTLSPSAPQPDVVTTTYVSVVCCTATFVDKKAGVLLASRQILEPSHDPCMPIVVCMLSKASGYMEMHVAEPLASEDTLNIMLLRVPSLAVPSISGALRLCPADTTKQGDRVSVTTFAKSEGSTRPTLIECKGIIAATATITSDLTVCQLDLKSCCEALSGGVVCNERGCVVGMLTCKASLLPWVFYALDLNHGIALKWLEHMLPTGCTNVANKKDEISKSSSSSSLVTREHTPVFANLPTGASLRCIPSFDSIPHLAHYVERPQAQAELLRALGSGDAAFQDSRRATDEADSGGASAGATHATNATISIGLPKRPKRAVAITNRCLQGRGGVGKTVLAKWAVQQPLIIDRYPLRLWVQLSQDPDVLHCLHELFVAVTRGHHKLAVNHEAKRDEQIESTKNQVLDALQDIFHVMTLLPDYKLDISMIRT